MNTITFTDSSKLEKTTFSTKKPLYFDTHMTIRISKEMQKLMDFWIKNQKCKDLDNKPLFTSRSHFIKVSMIKHFNELKEKYRTI